MTLPDVGFIGAGQIGEPMVEMLLAAGRRVIVYARREEVRARLADRGATIAETPDDLAVAPVVVTCLFTDDQVLELCTPIIEKMRPGSVFVSHTTGSPVAIRRLSDVGRGPGVSVVEAPFSGTPEAIRRRQLTVLLAGEDEAIEVVSDVVTAYSENPQRTGRHGTALAAKLLNNALFAACAQLTLSALEAGDSLGIDERTLLDVLAVSSGGSTAARYLASSGQDAKTYSARLPRYLRKDLASVKAVTSDLGIDIADLLAAAERGPMDLRDDSSNADRLEPARP
ncbi:NAD(P)-dependent oxidoreductase [Rhodococcus sp. NPDC003318]|uniref:NAD(P)-dependent oxidoreductase n=1 Tax=Rhodococcus sp. NPDC003318 TaxID=3364503 RepID=UPI003675C53E